MIVGDDAPEGSEVALKSGNFASLSVEAGDDELSIKVADTEKGDERGPESLRCSAYGESAVGLAGHKELARLWTRDRLPGLAFTSWSVPRQSHYR